MDMFYIAFSLMMIMHVFIVNVLVNEMRKRPAAWIKAGFPREFISMRDDDSGRALGKLSMFIIRFRHREIPCGRVQLFGNLMALIFILEIILFIAMALGFFHVSSSNPAQKYNGGIGS